MILTFFFLYSTANISCIQKIIKILG
jgi:hypothetical protein